jgi:hypothetical protein
MSNEEIINKAKELLQPITYEPFPVGYYVLRNGTDRGGSDYCENCIGDAVKEARKSHTEKRNSILDKYNQIKESGYFKVGKKKIITAGKYLSPKF